MPYTIDDVFSDDAIESYEQHLNGYSFKIKELSDTIRVLLVVNPFGGFNYFLSHAIHTPTQADPYRSSRPWGEYAAYALHMAITSLTDYYREAIKRGHAPTDKWLIKKHSANIIDAFFDDYSVS